MHPWIKSAFPGKCTVCGMDLVRTSRGSARLEKPMTNEVLLPPESVSASGIQTAVVKRAPLLHTLRFAGRFEEDASTHAVISAPVEGRIDGLGLVHGNGKVTQRQPLATIFSRTLLAAANEYKEALNHDEAAAVAAKRKLEQYGLVWEQIKAIPLRQDDDLYFGILSPRTGTVVKSYVSEGQYVREGDKLFEITNSAKLWFMFPAFEQDLPLLAVRQIVDIETTSLPGEKISASITSVGKHLDEATHSVHVRAWKWTIPRAACGSTATPRGSSICRRPKSSRCRGPRCSGPAAPRAFTWKRKRVSTNRAPSNSAAQATPIGRCSAA